MADLTFTDALLTVQDHPNSLESVSKAITYLGQASRTSPEGRDALAEPPTLKALLNFLEASLKEGKPTATTEPTLRCIGNAIICSDEGRQMVTEHGFGWVAKCLTSDHKDSGAKHMAFNCLYNICCDYAAAQKRCLMEHVHEDVLHWYHDVLTKRGESDKGVTGMVSDLLLSIMDQRSGDGVSPEDLALRDDATREHLLGCPLLVYDAGDATEDFATLIEVALVYMRDGEEQVRFITDGLVPEVWRLLQHVECAIEREAKAGDEEEVRLLVPLSTSLTWFLSDTAALPEFAARYGNRSDFVSDNIFNVIKKVGEVEGGPSTKSSRLVSAACQVLGNLLWLLKDKDLSTYDVNVLDMGLHRGLMGSVSTFKEAETLHSIAGLFVHMCRYSEDCRVRLCHDEQLSAVLETLCQSESKEVRQGGLRLLQLLGKDRSTIRENYAGLAKQVIRSLVAEQNAAQQQGNPQPTGGSVVELPD